MTRINSIKICKQIDILLLQNNNRDALALERQIFAEAVDKGVLHCSSETQFTKISSFFSRRKIQKLVGKILKTKILRGTVLEKYLEICKSKNVEPTILFLNTLFTEVRYPPEALKYLKKKYDAYFVLYYIDPVERGTSTYANYLREKDVFDLVFTFDKDDAYRYYLRFWQTPYSVMDVKQENIMDLYFCGVDKDRGTIINAISQVEQLDFSMDVIGIDSNSRYKDERIVVHKVGETISYQRVLERTLEANCILEIVRPGQVGYTLRTFEAVVYNKKLLTNNEHIKEFEFYNPKYMKIFKSVDDIDWNWVKEKNTVNYYYNGAFSPLKLIEEIERIRCQMEKSR